MRDLRLDHTEFGLIGTSFFAFFSLSAVLIGFVVNRVSVVAVGPGGFSVEAMVEGVSREELRARTGAELTFATNCALLRAPDLKT